MTSFNFSAEFVDMILSGEKTTTFRSIKKRQAPKVGDRFKLFTGQRTKNCRLLGTATVASVEEDWLLRGKDSTWAGKYRWDVTKIPAGLRYDQWVFNPVMHDDDAARAATQDGFKSIYELTNAIVRLNGGEMAIIKSPNIVDLTHPASAALLVLLPLRRVVWKDFTPEQTGGTVSG